MIGSSLFQSVCRQTRAPALVVASTLPQNWTWEQPPWSTTAPTSVSTQRSVSSGSPSTSESTRSGQEAAAGSDGTGDGLAGKTHAFEREEIRAALARANGVKTQAASALGMTYRGLLKKMQRLGL